MISIDFQWFSMIPSSTSREIPECTKKSKRNSNFGRIFFVNQVCWVEFLGNQWFFWGNATEFLGSLILLRKCNRFLAFRRCPGGRQNTRICNDFHGFPMVFHHSFINFQRNSWSHKEIETEFKFWKIFLCESSSLGGIPFEPVIFLRKRNGILGNHWFC